MAARKVDDGELADMESSDATLPDREEAVDDREWHGEVGS